jgi:hypothetical protein
MNDPRTTRTAYGRAAAGYDTDFEAKLAEAITTAIAEVSMVTDANAMIIRTGETVSALITVLAAMLAMSPAASRSPTAIRKVIDELHKRLRRRVAAAQADESLQEFLRRVFPGTDVGGNA